MEGPVENRQLPGPLTAFFGLIAGATLFLVAEALTPQQVATPGDHDQLLAVRLGLLFTPCVGLYLGWLQRSWRRALMGAGSGVLVGLLFMVLSSCRDFLAIMVGFPCLLGGLFAVLVGSNKSQVFGGMASRLWKGLLAGLVLGLVYAVVLNIVGFLLFPMCPDCLGDAWTVHYIVRMWKMGPVALGLGGAPFFVLIEWAVGLRPPVPSSGYLSRTEPLPG